MGERKVCVVTGSSSGIGAATARLYARNGWDVVINFSREAAPADAVAADCSACGVDALTVKADVSSDANCRRLATKVGAQFGRADVLANNAGTTKFVALKELEGLDAADFQRIYAVNVTGTYQMVRAPARLLQRHRVAGIVNISSIASRSPEPHLSPKPSRSCASSRRRGPDDLALLGSLREELGRQVLNGFTAALRATQVDSFMLGDMFNMREDLAAFRATVLVRGHGASPP